MYKGLREFPQDFHDDYYKYCTKLCTGNIGILLKKGFRTQLIFCVKNQDFFCIYLPVCCTVYK